MVIGRIIGSGKHLLKPGGKLLIEGAKKVVPIAIAASNVDDTKTLLQTVTDMLSPRKKSEIEPLDGNEAIKQISKELFMKTLNAENDMEFNNSPFSVNIIRNIGKGILSTTQYVVSAPLHLATNLGYHIPIAIYKGLFLKPLKETAIDAGSKIALYIGSDRTTGELTIRTGEALLAMIKAFFKDFIITIITFILIYKGSSFLIKKGTEIIEMKKKNKDKKNQEIDEFDVNDIDNY